MADTVNFPKILAVHGKGKGGVLCRSAFIIGDYRAEVPLLYLVHHKGKHFKKLFKPVGAVLCFCKISRGGIAVYAGTVTDLLGNQRGKCGTSVKWL